MGISTNSTAHTDFKIGVVWFSDFIAKLFFELCHWFWSLTSIVSTAHTDFKIGVVRKHPTAQQIMYSFLVIFQYTAHPDFKIGVVWFSDFIAKLFFELCHWFWSLTSIVSLILC